MFSLKSTHKIILLVLIGVRDSYRFLLVHMVECIDLKIVYQYKIGQIVQRSFSKKPSIFFIAKKITHFVNGQS